MALRRITSNGRGLFEIVKCSENTKLYVILLNLQTRCISSLAVTKNMTLLSEFKKPTKVINLKLDKPEEKPLVVLLSWLMAKKKHIHKYADVYLKNGFDVLNISLSPWQLLWPTKGSQVVANDLLKFLDLNTSYAPLVVHGFSVGGYLWSEVLVNIAAERERYSNVVDRIAGQIWDSAADITEISVGLPMAVFPNSDVLRNALKQYIIYHLSAFDKVATRHYIRANQMFYTNLVRAPAQIFISKSDTIGTETSNLRVKECWENMGIRVSWQCWDKSPHVGHFREHQEEYLAALMEFLHSIKLSKSIDEQKIELKL